MASTLPPAPSLASFRQSLPSKPVDGSTENLISLLKRRQIKGAKSSALATAWLLRKVISSTRANEPGKMAERVQAVGKKLVEAAPREPAIGNIVRRVLGAIREEDENRAVGSPDMSDIGSGPATPGYDLISATLAGQTPPNNTGSGKSLDPNAVNKSLFPPVNTPGVERRPLMTSMFSMLAHPTMRASGTASPIQSGSSTPLNQSQILGSTTDFRAEVLEAITEIVDELDQADDQIANYAFEHVSPQDTIFTYSSSTTVQKFLLKAASKRKFTVIHAEGYPNNHKKTHALVTGDAKSLTESNEDSDAPLDANAFQKPLIAAGITVILIPDSAIFAMMSRAHKVVLSAQSVMSNGSILASAGSKALMHAAKCHRVPVIVLAATYKLSPRNSYNLSEMIEYGNAGKIVPYQDRELNRGLQSIRNPVNDFVEASHVDLFITNLGGCSAGFLYSLIRDQYHVEDVDL